MDNKTVVTTDISLGAVAGAQQILMSDLPDVASDDFDGREFGSFLRNMKGTKSVREFAVETGLSESFLSKAINGFIRKRPTKRTLLKLLHTETGGRMDWRELAKVAGYKDLELDLGRMEFGATQQLSTAAAITRYYGEDHFAVMCELMKALAEHGLKGDMTCCFYREAGYFEVTDNDSGQVYVGINAYLKPAKDDDEDEWQADAGNEDSIVFSIAFSVGLTYNRITASDGAMDKVVYVLTDNERVYDGCRSVLPKNTTKATVVVLTDDHMVFRKEDILSGSEQRPISLVD